MTQFKRIARLLAAPVFWILVWEAAAWRVGNVLLFPSPRVVLLTLLDMMKTQQFYQITLKSLWNVTAGILYAWIAGILLAAITHRLRILRELTLPIMTVIKATPVASFIVLMLIWVGSAKVPTLITFMIVLPVAWTNLDEGLQRQSKELRQVTEVYRFSPWKRLCSFTVPSVMPYFSAACRTSMGLAWKAGIAAEIIAMPRHSIGAMIGSAKQYLNTEEMFAWTLTVVLLSLLIEQCFVVLLKKLDRYHGKREDTAC